MKTIKIKNVGLSDLHQVLSIYKDSGKTIAKASTLQLTEDFGLPLAIAKHNNEVVAYAFTPFQAKDGVEILSNFKPGFDDKETQQLLMSHAAKVLHSIKVENQHNQSKVQLSIQKLTDWLNWSN